MKYDAIIVGAGFSGAVIAERLASQLDYKVLIIEKRNHIAGNCYDYAHTSGIRVHKYGPHLFHTNNESVWKYLSLFTEWSPYRHKVRGYVDEKYIPIPFNLKSLALTLPDSYQNLKRLLIDTYGYGSRVSICELLEAKNPELNKLANFVYEKVFVGYTVKQWGVAPEQLSQEVLKRVPVVISEEDGYFADKYQAMPIGGYSSLIESILSHKNIEIELDQDAHSLIEFDVKARKAKFSQKAGVIIYTGAVDELFSFKFGELDYRSLTFKLEEHSQEFYQPATTVNYPGNEKHTRTTEFKYIDNTSSDSTVIVKEFPQQYKRGVEGRDIPYYPLFDKKNEAIYLDYANHAKQFDNLFLAGRLAKFKYFNMDEAVQNALETSEQIIKQATA